MRIIFLAGAALAIVGCGKNASQNNAVAAPDNRAAIVATAAPAGNAAVAATQGAPMNAAAAADRAPPAMLGDDPDAQGAGCVVFLGQAEPAGAEYARASAAWRAGLVRRLGEDGAAQLIGSSVNPLEDTPPAARRAAVDWCAAHPPAGG